jgi:hypothetical protein
MLLESVFEISARRRQVMRGTRKIGKQFAHGLSYACSSAATIPIMSNTKEEK